MRLLVWLFRGFLFFVLFAFALNNLHAVSVNWFFGVHWNAPLVIVVLAAFGAGCAMGVLAMVPAWWKQRRQTRQPAPHLAGAPVTVPATMPPVTTPPDYAPEHPPRVGL